MGTVCREELNKRSAKSKFQLSVLFNSLAEYARERAVGQYGEDQLEYNMWSYPNDGTETFFGADVLRLFVIKSKYESLIAKITLFKRHQERYWSLEYYIRGVMKECHCKQWKPGIDLKLEESDFRKLIDEAVSR